MCADRRDVRGSEPDVQALRSLGLTVRGVLGYKSGLPIVSTSFLEQTPTGSAPWTLRSLIASHRVASMVVAALCVVTVAILTLVVVGPKAGAVTDSTTCAQWSSANVSRQDAYARLYVKEHGPVAKGWGPAPTGVINAINAGCYQAFGEDVSDSATVVQAISRDF